MKTKLLGLIAMAIMATTIIGCKEDEPTVEQPQVQPNTPRNLSFGTTENPLTVTIKSDDQFTATEWKTLCDKVEAAIMRGYNKYEGAEGLTDIGNKDLFKDIFAGNISIFLLKSTIYDCEVKTGDTTSIYLKTSTLDTVDIQPAVSALDMRQAYKHP